MLLAAIAFTTAWGGATRSALQFSRPEIADGEVWRLVTAHIVHLGPLHAALNALALGVWALLARNAAASWRQDLRGLAVAVLGVSAGLWWLTPEVAWYAGLSGVLHGLYAGLVPDLWRTRRPVAVALGLGLALKIAVEAGTGPANAISATIQAPVITAAHAYGTAAVLAASALGRAFRRRTPVSLLEQRQR